MSLDSYDQVPYPSLPSRRTHISHLAAIARLLGLKPPAPSSARVLELGCAAGGNIIPMAGDFPEAQLVGLDLSERQIAAGQDLIASLGLANIELRQADLLTVDPAELGSFDYILCHGVYSWVPPAVQQRILALGRRSLRGEGVMFVSFNALPGWRLRGMVREMLTYHVAGVEQPREKIEQARALLAFLINSAAPRTDVYRQLLREEAEILEEMGDAYLFHEHLETDNEPLYFHEFARRVEGAGLQYLGDADFASMLPSNLGPEAAEQLSRAPLLKSEQYIDFLVCRTFRGALLVQPECRPDRQVTPERIGGLSIALDQRVEFSPGDEGGSLVVRGRDATVTVRHPRLRDALFTLQERYPTWLHFDELAALVIAHDSGAATVDDREALAGDLLMLYASRLLRLWAEPPPCLAAPSDRPATTPLARWQAKQGLTATNRRHERVRLSPGELFLLALLDGDHSRSQLADDLRAAVERGHLELRRNDQPAKVANQAELRQLADELLASLAQNALLIK